MVVKDPEQNAFARLRQKMAEAMPGARADRLAASGDPLEPPWTPPVENTGETVFGDRPLRFRSLTVAEADLAVLEAPKGFHGGFKIRVAKLGQRRREAGRLVERRYAGRGYTIRLRQNHLSRHSSPTTRATRRHGQRPSRFDGIVRR